MTEQELEKAARKIADRTYSEHQRQWPYAALDWGVFFRSAKITVLLERTNELEARLAKLEENRG